MGKRIPETAKMPPSEGEFRFDVDCGLLFQLGEGLVSKRSIALAELIKNSYDADATHVIIGFRDVSAPGGEITILDDGTGIPFSRIRDTWMRIATTEKERNPVSEVYGRQRAGEKGVGRFATRRLAKELELESVALVDPRRKTGPREKTTVHFDWGKFKPGKEVQDVAVAYRYEIVKPSTPTGVMLRLNNVRDVWSEHDLRDLYIDLMSIITPLPKGRSIETDGSKRDPGFSVELEVPEFPEYSESPGERFLKSALAVLEGDLAADGTATYKLKFRRKPSDRRKLSHTFRLKEERFPHAGPAFFQIYYFVFKPDEFAGLDINVRDARKKGREQGGVHIFVDRFRVPPYGDLRDDWLGLDEDRARRKFRPKDEVKILGKDVFRPGLVIPGNNQLFGQVFLSRSTNPQFHQTLNRERLQENDAFRELRSFVRLGVDWMTIMYARHTEEERAKGRAERRSVSRSPKTLIARAREQIESLDMTSEQRKEALQALDLADQAIEEEREEQIGELQMLRVLASTGTMIFVFDHELLGVLQGLRETHRDLGSFLRHISGQERRQFHSVLEGLKGWIEDAEHQATLLGLLLGDSARRRRRRLAVRSVAGALLSAFGKYAEDLQIEMTNQVPATLRTPPMFECELSAILVNLITNALKAVKPQPLRKIEISGHHNAESVSIRVSDTGIGADPTKWSEYFKPFVSESVPDPVLGVGTGLGLKIVKDFVEVYGGDTRFVEPEEPWRTSVEVRIPEA